MVIEKDFVASMLTQVATEAVQVVAEPVIEEPTKPTCTHHWVIETAHGPVSWGVCQVCREGKEFQNSIGEIEREN
jgi:hypothetical protein